MDTSGQGQSTHKTEEDEFLSLDDLGKLLEELSKQKGMLLLFVFVKDIDDALMK